MVRKKKAKRSTKVLTDEEWAIKKARSWRTSSLARAKRMGIDNSHVPTVAEYHKWIQNCLPLRCYFTNTEIPRDSVELDHKKPITRGGDFSLSNSGITTRFYNNAKGTMDEGEFRGLLEVLKGWEDKGKSLLLRLISSNNIFKRKSK
jgi:hypothetical protein